MRRDRTTEPGGASGWTPRVTIRVAPGSNTNAREQAVAQPAGVRMTVRIVTDSACDLPESICAELGIEVVPLTIRFGDREYVDRKELTTDAFWRELATSSVLPETSAPSVGAFEETFHKL